ncbi:MAG TPA: SDR family NAD(P)-dependent oxidoreductase, partial [Thermoanaerobaculia bacterium]|nr:SDR family NAD(P)-dependent oxidoreductase [Thermoanaerobaculia bacterium]
MHPLLHAHDASPSMAAASAIDAGRHNAPRRLRLPVHPFAGERHWIDAAYPATVSLADALHPLLHARASALDPERDAVRGAAITRPRIVSLPRHPFTRARHWPAARQSAAAVTTAAETLCFEEHWREEPLATPVPPHDGPTIVFCASPEDAADLAGAITVHDGAAYTEHTERLFTARLADRHDLRAVLARIAATRPAPLSIVHAWSRGRGEAGVHALFALFQAIHDSAAPVAQVTLVGNDDPHSLSGCWDASWLGFARSLRGALPETRVAILYTAGPWSAAAIADAAHNGGAIRHDGERRFVLSLRPVSPHPLSARPPAENRGYLITGGCGALGQSIARHLAESEHARLLLLGRSSPDDTIRGVLDALRRAGAREAHYAAADVADAAALHALSENLPFPLAGIIHAAGIESRALFHEKSPAAIDAVLRPKIAGSILLDEVFGAQPLDLVCHVSSSSAMLGDFGACDYAIANRFQTAYAVHRQTTRRHNGRTVVINWPLWADGGMGTDSDLRALYLASSGQEALETARAIGIWDDLLRDARTQTLVLRGDRPRIEAFLQRLYGATPLSPAIERPRLASDWIAPPDAILADLRRLTSEFLSIPPDELDDATNLSHYGFDSLQLSEFAKKLTAHFGVTISAVVFFNAATIGQLAAHLVREYGVRARGGEPPPEISTVAIAPQSAAVPHTEREDDGVAIVGMAGRFPGARTVEQLWILLAEGKSAIGEIPEERWGELHDGAGDAYNRIAANRGGFIEGVDEFDPLFFEIAPREAEQMDPGERLLLMEAYRALEDAGISPASLRGSRTGVFAGMEESDYDQLTGRRGITTSGGAMISSRLSYFLDLRGPAVATNTACSSGLVALHQAVLSLRLGECDTALVAGVALHLTPAGTIAMSEAGMLSPDGLCRSFSRDANGIGVGEAVVVLVLQPLKAALAGGARIYGVVRGSGVNFDGRTNGVTAPNGQMQAELIAGVHARAGINPRHVTHIVAHGTGTPLGDPVELDALRAAFRKLDPAIPAGNCAITSCKSNVGHTMAASGLVSVVSLLEGMRHATIPASLHCEVESEHFPWHDSPFRVNKTTRQWERRGDRPFLGAVSAFGRSGTNAHVVIEEFRSPAHAPEAPGVRTIVPLSARTPEQLQERALDLLQFLRSPQSSALSFADVAWTLQSGREAMTERAGFVAASIDELAAKLEAFLRGDPPVEGGMARGQVRRNRESLAWLSGDADLQIAIDRWMARGNLSRLLELWVRGVDLDWSRLCPGIRPRRVRLPLYPFTRERYWIDSPPSRIVNAHSGENAAALHPLLHCAAARLERPHARTIAGDAAGRRPRLMALPAHPFVRERHWVPRTAQPSTPSTLHPLVHESAVALRPLDIAPAVVPRSDCPRRLRLPLTPFAGERHWIAPAPSHNASAATLHPLLHVKVADVAVQCDAAAPLTELEGKPPRFVALPTYPFTRNRHWAESSVPQPAPAARTETQTLLYEEYWAEEPRNAALADV